MACRLRSRDSGEVPKASFVNKLALGLLLRRRGELTLRQHWSLGKVGGAWRAESRGMSLGSVLPGDSDHSLGKH